MTVWCEADWRIQSHWVTWPCWWDICLRFKWTSCLTSFFISIFVLKQFFANSSHRARYWHGGGWADSPASPIYQVSHETRTQLEVKFMLEHNIAEASSSSWVSPRVLVSKPDQTFRQCTDFQKVSKITRYNHSLTHFLVWRIVLIKWAQQSLSVSLIS